MITRQWNSILSDDVERQAQPTDRYVIGKRKDLALYYRARQAWMNWSEYRTQRERVKRYLFGDQWGDLVCVDGKWMTERRMMENQGIHPLSSKYMYKYYNKLKSMYSENLSNPIVFARQEDADTKSSVLTDTLITNCDNDGLADILPQQFGELLTSGMAIVCEEWGRLNTNDDEDSHTIEVNPDYVGMEVSGRDCQMRDISLLVEIRDYYPDDLAAELDVCGGDIRATINRIYGYNLGDKDVTPAFDVNKDISYDTPRKGLCRTYRVWTKEKRKCYHVVDILNESTPMYKVSVDDTDTLAEIDAENNRRIKDAGGMSDNIVLIEVDMAHPFIDDYYKLTILAPDATVLYEGENPYEHGLLPYTICVYEFSDGNIVPFFSYILEQQRSYNRALTQKDTMTERALKDLKMVPYDCVPTGMSPKTFSEQFHIIGNTIFYKPSRTGAVPQIISSNSRDVGLNDLLSIYRGDMEEVTNENSAFMGKEPKSGTPTSRYMVEAENSGGTFATMMKRYESFEKNVYYKKLCNIQQYYTSERIVNNSQNGGMSGVVSYKPTEVGDIKFTVKISRGLNTPLARMQEDGLADMLLGAQAITPLQRIMLGWTPNKEKFMQILQMNEERAQKGESQDGQ